MRSQRPTRGKTAPGRLRAVDAWLVRHERELLLREGVATVVDVGLGALPWTTLETASALRQVRPDLRVVGLDLDPERVAVARLHADALTEFQVGGLGDGGPARVVRAMNLLRQYREGDVPAARAALGRAAEVGGLVVEGSTDKAGGVVCAHLLRKRDARSLSSEGLLLWTDFSRGFAPILFRDWLPRDLRRGVVPGRALHEVFSAWTDRWEAVRARGPRQSFAGSVAGLGVVDLDLAGGSAVVLSPGSWADRRGSP